MLKAGNITGYGPKHMSVTQLGELENIQHKLCKLLPQIVYNAIAEPLCPIKLWKKQLKRVE